MAITIVSGAVTAATQPFGNPNLGIPEPAGATDGDLALAFTLDFSIPAQPTTPNQAGWTEILNWTSGNWTMQAFWRAALAADTGYAFQNAGNDRNVGYGLALRGAHVGEPADYATGTAVNIGAQPNPNVATITAPSLTAPEDGCLYVATFLAGTFNGNNDTVTWTDPPGTTRLGAQRDANFLQTLIVYKFVDAGATGTFDAVVTAPYGMGIGQAQAVLVRPEDVQRMTVGYLPLP